MESDLSWTLFTQVNLYRCKGCLWYTYIKYICVFSTKVINLNLLESICHQLETVGPVTSKYYIRDFNKLTCSSRRNRGIKRTMSSNIVESLKFEVLGSRDFFQSIESSNYRR